MLQGWVENKLYQEMPVLQSRIIVIVIREDTTCSQLGCSMCRKQTGNLPEP